MPLTLKQLKLTFWNIFGVWFAATLICSVLGGYFISKAQSHQHEIARALYNEYHSSLPLTPLAALSKAQTDAIYYNHYRDEVVKHNSLKFASYVYDIEMKNEKLSRSIGMVFLWPGLILIVCGVLFTLVYIFWKPIKWLVRKRFDKKELIRLTALVLALISIGMISGYFLKDKDRNDYSVASEIQDLTFKVYGAFAELSNEFYALAGIDSFQSQLSKLEYIKLKTKERIEKLKNLKPINHKGVFDFDSERLVQPAIMILEKIYRYAEMATHVSNNQLEMSSNTAKSQAEFEIILEKLDGFYSDTLPLVKHFSNVTPLMLGEEAKERYEVMAKADSNATYSIYLIFGYRLYKTIMNNLETNDAKERERLTFSDYGK